MICGNVFDKIDDELFQKIYDKIDFLAIEFDSFHVGSRIDKEIQKRDDELSQKLNLDVEPIKKEINRVIGRDLEKSLGKKLSFREKTLLLMLI